MTLAGARVVITGGGSGIGRATALACARAGADVVVADVDAAAADATALELRDSRRRALAVRMDVTDDTSVAQARELIAGTFGAPNVLINNAGTVSGGAFTTVPLPAHLATYEVNLVGLVRVTHAFLPDLLAAPAAHVVNLASASGLLGVPFAATYASSKWGVIGFSESLRQELRELGHRHVGVTAVCPSYVRTGLFEGARAPWLTPYLTPEAVAAHVVRAVERDRPFVAAPFMVRLIPALRGLLPRPLFEATARVFGVSGSMRHWRGRDPERR